MTTVVGAQTRTVSGYMKAAFDPDLLIRIAERTIDIDDLDSFDTMIGTGLSGALAIPTLARYFGKNWAIVRKDNDNSHGMYRVEGTFGNSWVFVDDLIASGRTLCNVFAAMKNHIDRRNLLVNERIAYNKENPGYEYPDEDCTLMDMRYVGTFEYDNETYKTLSNQVNGNSYEWYSDDLQSALRRAVADDGNLNL